MTKINFKNLISNISNGQKAIKSLSPSDRKKLEDKWDVEHAYYSSVLEGSKLDRKQFDQLARETS